MLYWSKLPNNASRITTSVKYIWIIIFSIFGCLFEIEVDYQHPRGTVSTYSSCWPVWLFWPPAAGQAGSGADCFCYCYCGADCFDHQQQQEDWLAVVLIVSWFLHPHHVDLFDCFDQQEQQQDWQWCWLLFTSPLMILHCWSSLLGHIKPSVCSILSSRSKTNSNSSENTTYEDEQILDPGWFRIHYSLGELGGSARGCKNDDQSPITAVRWTNSRIMSGCKKKRGSFFIEICCEFVKENIGTKFPTFCEGKYLLRSLQSQSKFLSKCQNPNICMFTLNTFEGCQKSKLQKSILHFFTFLLEWNIAAHSNAHSAGIMKFSGHVLLL